MTQYLFIGFLAFLIAAIAAASFRYLERSTARTLLGGLLVWLNGLGGASGLCPIGSASFEAFLWEEAGRP